MKVANVLQRKFSFNDQGSHADTILFRDLLAALGKGSGKAMLRVLVDLGFIHDDLELLKSRVILKLASVSFTELKVRVLLECVSVARFALSAADCRVRTQVGWVEICNQSVELGGGQRKSSAIVLRSMAFW